MGIGVRKEERQMQEMRVSTFLKTYDIPRSTFNEWLHRSDFAGVVALKVCERWRIKIPEYEQWREKQHKNCYKYA